MKNFLRTQLFVCGVFSLTNPQLNTKASKFVHNAEILQNNAHASGKNGPKQSLLNVNALERTGQLSKALQMSNALLTKTSNNQDVFLAHIRILQKLGKHTLAISLLKKRKETTSTTFALANSLIERGQSIDGNRLFKSIALRYENDAIAKDSKEDLLAAANANKALGNHEKANSIYQSLIDQNDAWHDVNIAWGNLFYSTHDYKNASESYKAVLKFDPNHPGAHFGLANISYSKDYDIERATNHIDKVLAINPLHQDALCLLATIKNDERAWVEARTHLLRLLKVNPNNLHGLSLLATNHWLQNKRSEYSKTKDKVFSLNKEYGQFFHVVAQGAEHAYHYEDAVSFEKKALQLSPTHKNAMHSLALGHLRLGQEDKAMLWLKKSYKADPYNIRTVNILDLYQSFIPEQYLFLETPHFKIRYHKDEATLLHRYVGPFIENAYKQLSKRYQVDLSEKIVLELYKEPEHYSVRTIGVPNLGALAICFGKVITAMSPTSGGNNWQMVLWHELSHVFAIQLSKSKVPRWFTEGLSEYETIRVKPEWRREQHRSLYNHSHNQTLPNIESLNSSFTKGDLRHAYFQSSKVIEFIVEQYGFDSILRALKQYAKSKEDKETLEQATGVTLASLNDKYKNHIGKLLAVYKGRFNLPEPRPLTSLAPKTSNDSTEQELESTAVKLFTSGAKKLSAKTAEELLQKSPHHPTGSYILAELAYAESDYPKARFHYQNLIENGSDSYDIRVRLATLASQRGDNEESIKQLCAAKANDPESSYPYQKLSEHYEKEGDDDKMLLELENVAAIDQSDFGAHLKLVKTYLSKGNSKNAVYYGEKALALNPVNGELLLMLAKAYSLSSQHQNAIFTYDSLLALTPKTRRPALAELGKAKAYLKLRDKENAMDALERARDLEPENLDVLTLMKSLPNH